MKKHTHKRSPKIIKRKSNKKSYKKIISIVSSIILTSLFAVVLSNYIFTDDKKTIVDIPKKENIKSVQPIKLIQPKKENYITFEEKTKALEIEYIKNADNNVYVAEQPEEKLKEDTFHYEEPDYGKVDDIEPIVPVEIKPIEEKTKIEKIEKKKIKTNEPEKVIVKVEIEKKGVKKDIKKDLDLPKLVIIIDDVTTKKQIKRIKNIGYIVNMSFLPPTKGHKKSATITNNLENYMIHLPLQASNWKYEEEDTLHITDDFKKIERKIIEVKKLYPKAKFINNHTGSKFTSNKVAMDKLFEALKKHNFHFIDSRTTAKSVAELSAKKYGVKMLSRNIFLDNNKNKKYIQGQLKKAIKIANKHGLAIAIGHPYKITLKTLKESKHLLKGLELIYVDKL